MVQRFFFLPNAEWSTWNTLYPSTSEHNPKKRVKWKKMYFLTDRHHHHKIFFFFFRHVLRHVLQSWTKHLCWVQTCFMPETLALRSKMLRTECFDFDIRWKIQTSVWNPLFLLCDPKWHELPKDECFHAAEQVVNVLLVFLIPHDFDLL